MINILLSRQLAKALNSATFFALSRVEQARVRKMFQQDDVLGILSDEGRQELQKLSFVPLGKNALLWLSPGVKFNWDEQGDERYEFPLAPETKFNDTHESDGRFGSGSGGTHVPLEASNESAVAKRNGQRLEQETNAFVATLNSQERTALDTYTAGGYEMINTGLRGQTTLSSDNTQTVHLLDGILQQASFPSTTQVIRGIADPQGALWKTFQEKAQTQGIFEDKAFVSTTLSEIEALNFKRGDGITAYVKIPEGAHALYTGGISERPSELEVLLPRNSQFRVLSTRTEMDTRFVTLEPVFPGKKHVEKPLSHRHKKAKNKQVNKFIWQDGDIVWQDTAEKHAALSYQDYMTQFSGLLGEKFSDTHESGTQIAKFVWHQEDVTFLHAEVQRQYYVACRVPGKKFNPNYDEHGEFASGGGNAEAITNGYTTTYTPLLQALPGRQRAAIVAYAGQQSGKMNDALRSTEGQERASQKTLQRIADASKGLESITVQQPVVAFRYMQDDFGAFYSFCQQHLGETIMDKGFLSTSMDNPKVFSNNIVMEIHVPAGVTGAYLQGISAHPEEHEFLFPPGRPLKVTSTTSVSGFNRVVMDMLKAPDGASYPSYSEPGYNGAVDEEQDYSHDAKFNDTHESDGRFGSGDGSVALVRAQPVVLHTLLNDHSDVLHAMQQGAFGKGLRTYMGDMTGNMRTAVVMHMQGFDGKPTVMDTPTFDAYVKSGATEVMRGVTSADFADQFKTGPYYAGDGIFGNGTYTAAGPDMQVTAKDYAKYGDGPDQQGAVIRMALSPDARVISYTDASAQYQRWSRALSVKLDNEENGEQRRLLQGASNLVRDEGTWAALRGYDAIHVVSENFYVVLNRTAVAVDGGPKK